MRRLKTADAAFWSQLDQLLAPTEVEQEVNQVVSTILAAVKEEKDRAVLRYTRQFDNVATDQVAQLELSKAQQRHALERITREQRVALETAAQRITEFAHHQKQNSWIYQDRYQSEFGQRITALNRVGVYVPGGKAAYPSSVLMNVIPAKVAGVKEIVMAVPTPNGEHNDMVLAAATIAGVDRIFTIGGAQAIAAFAYGTETIPKVDKIVGPGNQYVATAKRLVYGSVGIDMIAGPSEVVIVCDDTANPHWVAVDMYAQAEHDELARAIVISSDPGMLDKIAAELANNLTKMTRATTIAAALTNRGAIIQTRDVYEAIAVANFLSPEHLELCVCEPNTLLDRIQNAGAIFLGHYSPEVFGDYCAGPNHVLPTSATARFASSLGVYDFQKRTSIVHCSQAGAQYLSDIAVALANSEGLTAHAYSAKLRGNT